MTQKENFLYDALDIFKDMIKNGECSKQDISHFVDMSKYELDRRGASVGKKSWLSKIDASNVLGVSTSTFDRIVLNGGMPRGRKVVGQRNLVWRREQVEQLKNIMLLKGTR